MEEQKEYLPTNQENKIEISKNEPEKKEETKNSLKSAKNFESKIQKEKA